jgi:putative ABC transport system ATP-binding protein
VAGRSLLENVCIDVCNGERITIVGPTGSGKTLLLRALAMLDPVDAGDVLWHGRRVQGSEVPTFRSRVVYLHQRPVLVEGTVQDNLRQPFLLRIHRNKQFQQDILMSQLAALGREESFLAKDARDLSGGEAQITAFLRATLLEPEVLLLDEPTSALDRAATEMVEKLIATWIREKPHGRAFVCVTHNHEQAERIASRVFTMNQGVLNLRS